MCQNKTRSGEIKQANPDTTEFREGQSTADTYII